MADEWEQYARKPQAAEDEWGKYARPVTPEIAPRVGGQRVLDFANEALSNIPSSAGKFIGNIGQAVAHPIDTAAGLTKTATGAFEKATQMAGMKTPTSEIPLADAAIQGAKDRFGSLDAIANTIKTDPVGAAADVASVIGGVSGIARGLSGAARVASLPRVASTAGRVADIAGTISDVANPLTVPTKAVGAVAKGIGRGLGRNALGLTGRTERYGATPAQALMENTRGIRPSTIAESANAKLEQLSKQLDSLPATRDPDLSAARQVVRDEIRKVQSANGNPSALMEMDEQLRIPRPGFAGAVDPSGEISATQAAPDFLAMKRQFGDDYTKFDHSIPIKDSARKLKVGNQAYHKMAEDYNSAVPGAREVNQQMQSTIPVRDAAQRTAESAGPLDRAINRATRPTGALAAVVLGLKSHGIFGGLEALGIQEALASPTLKMAGARTAYGAGKTIGSKYVRRGLNTAGVADEAMPPPLDTPGQQR